jgi:hypothetical protein
MQEDGNVKTYRCEKIKSHNIPNVKLIQEEMCGLPGYYTAPSGNHLLTFRDNVSILIIKREEIQEEKGVYFLSFENGTIRCPETSVKDYHSTVRNISEVSRSNQHRSGSLKSRLMQ